MIWIPILDPDSRYRSTKTISPIGKGREHAPGWSVCLYGLSVCDLACLLGSRACRNTSTTRLAKYVPDPTSCCDGHYNPSVTIPSCRGFHNPFAHEPTTFATDPRVVGSVTGSAPVEHLHKTMHRLHLILN